MYSLSCVFTTKYGKHAKCRLRVTCDHKTSATTNIIGLFHVCRVSTDEAINFQPEYQDKSIVHLFTAVGCDMLIQI